VFDVSPPIAAQLVPFARWVASLPPSQRPKTAAYPMGNDPFTVPMVQTARSVLAKAGVRTVYSKIFPEETPDYKPVADQVAAANPQLVVLGSIDVPSVSAFMTAFEQQHYNPRLFAAAAGPDQGAAFLSAVGVHNATGIFVPNGWYGGEPNPLSQAMVKAYIANYGGTASGINADVAEAYAVGQAAADAVNATHSVDNAKIISYLHSGVTLHTVEGSARFNSVGENVAGSVFTFQWQRGGKFVQVLPAGAPGSVPVVNPKPAWGKG
jgi:branched-chain amino acid transport system substrate-binding protein